MNPYLKHLHHDGLYGLSEADSKKLMLGLLIGSVALITIPTVLGSISYDYSRTYEPLDYEYVFTIINEMYDDHYPDVIAAHLADEVDPKHIEDALEEALEDQMHPKDPTVKILKMALDY